MPHIAPVVSMSAVCRGTDVTIRVFGMVVTQPLAGLLVIFLGKSASGIAAYIPIQSFQ
jgi:hypothetical protein